MWSVWFYAVGHWAWSVSRFVHVDGSGRLLRAVAMHMSDARQGRPSPRWAGPVAVVLGLVSSVLLSPLAAPAPVRAAGSVINESWRFELGQDGWQPEVAPNGDTSVVIDPARQPADSL